jgi:phospholipid/cholesterol/gamma-HCH transport system substrate-binding protein
MVRTGSETKVGLITLLAIALLAVFTFYLRGSLLPGRTFTLYVVFDNARGLQRGDPVRMVGVKIGEVRRVGFTPEGHQAQAELAIAREVEGRPVRLYRNYVFQIASAGLIQERFIEVMPSEVGEEGLLLPDQAKVIGVTGPDLASLLAAGREVLANLNLASRRVTAVLSDQAVISKVNQTISGFAEAAEGATRVIADAAKLLEESQPQARAILTQLSLAAANLESSTKTLRRGIEQGTTLAHLAEAAGSIRDAGAEADRLLTDLRAMVTSPRAKLELSETLSAIHGAALSMYQVGADLVVFSEELRKAAPSVPVVAKQAERVSTTVTQLQERLKPPEIQGNFRVLYSGEAGRTFSTGSLDFTTSKDRFLRLGIDDIGEESTVNVQLGEQQRRGALRYGLVRSRLGLGYDLLLSRRALLSVEVFDPNRLRADILADVPMILGTGDLGIMAGVRDLGEENLFVFGARLRR